MTGLHPAIAFLRDRMQSARALAPDTLVLEVEGTRVEIFVVSADSRLAFFAAGPTKLSYRCRGEIPDRAKESLRPVLLELARFLSAGGVMGPDGPLPKGGAWTNSVRGEDLPAWRDWVVQSYRTSIEGGRQQDTCAGLPACLDTRMRPPIQPPSTELAEAPESGPCSRCGRARYCFAARDHDVDVLKPLRHADAVGAEIAALRVLAEASSVPLARALEAHSVLADACGDRAIEGALPLEYSVRLPAGGRQPDRLRFVSYYPLVTSDAVRLEIGRGRREAVRAVSARWLTSRETGFLDTWLECAAQTQPATLGLSIGMDIDPSRVRLQVYAHPEPNDDGERFVNAVVAGLGGSVESIPKPASPAVLVGLALSVDQPPALKLYYHRHWAERDDTGLLSDGLGSLEPFNPGWGLAIQEHVDGRADWVKWDFPVTTHFQDYQSFLDAFWTAVGTPRESVPEWLSGEHFSPWPTWASLGRGGWALYFQAR